MGLSSWALLLSTAVGASACAGGGEDGYPVRPGTGVGGGWDLERRTAARGGYATIGAGQWMENTDEGDDAGDRAPGDAQTTEGASVRNMRVRGDDDRSEDQRDNKTARASEEADKVKLEDQAGEGEAPMASSAAAPLGVTAASEAPLADAVARRSSGTGRGTMGYYMEHHLPWELQQLGVPRYGVRSIEPILPDLTALVPALALDELARARRSLRQLAPHPVADAKALPGVDPAAAQALRQARAALSPWSKEFAAVWHFDETALASARDATGTGHTGAARGTRLTAGLIGQGRAFTAAAKDAVVVADAPELTFETFTISAWTRYDKPPGQLYFTSMSRQFNAFGENELFLSNFAGKANAEIATTAGSFVTSGGALPLSRWVHLAAVYDGVALTLYVDGRPSASLPASGRPARTANPLFLGADRNNGSGNTPPGVPDADFLDGALDEVRVERTARSAAWQEASYLAMQDQAISYGPVQLALP